MFPYNGPLCQICHCSLLLRREIDKTCERWVLLGSPHLSFSNHMRHNTCVSSQPNHLINSIIMQVFPLKVWKIQLQSNQLWNHRHAALLRLLRRGNANQVMPRLKILRWIFLFIVFFFKFAYCCYSFICLSRKIGIIFIRHPSHPVIMWRG